jgi:hypothetical protein
LYPTFLTKDHRFTRVASQTRRATLRWIIWAGSGMDPSDCRDALGGGHWMRARTPRRSLVEHKLAEAIDLVRGR